MTSARRRPPPGLIRGLTRCPAPRPRGGAVCHGLPGRIRSLSTIWMIPIMRLRVARGPAEFGPFEGLGGERGGEPVEGGLEQNAFHGLAPSSQSPCRSPVVPSTASWGVFSNAAAARPGGLSPSSCRVRVRTSVLPPFRPTGHSRKGDSRLSTVPRRPRACGAGRVTAEAGVCGRDAPDPARFGSADRFRGGAGRRSLPCDGGDIEAVAITPFREQQ